MFHLDEILGGKRQIISLGRTEDALAENTDEGRSKSTICFGELTCEL